MNIRHSYFRRDGGGETSAVAMADLFATLFLAMLLLVGDVPPGVRFDTAKGAATQVPTIPPSQFFIGRDGVRAQSPEGELIPTAKLQSFLRGNDPKIGLLLYQAELPSSVLVEATSAFARLGWNIKVQQAEWETLINSENKP
jgi:hypothetical protein